MNWTQIKWVSVTSPQFYTETGDSKWKKWKSKLITLECQRNLIILMAVWIARHHLNWISSRELNRRFIACNASPKCRPQFTQRVAKDCLKQYFWIKWQHFCHTKRNPLNLIGLGAYDRSVKLDAPFAGFVGKKMAPNMSKRNKITGENIRKQCDWVLLPWKNSSWSKTWTALVR